MNNLVAALGVGGAVMAADYAGKEFARSNVDLFHAGEPTADSRKVGPLPLYVVHSRNEHIARGLLPDDTERTVAMVAAPVSLAGIAFAGSKGGRMGAVGAGITAAGVLGNMGEFVTRGYVTDYIGVPGLPMTPNLSDVALIGGAGLLTVGALRGGGASRAVEAMRLLR